MASGGGDGQVPITVVVPAAGTPTPATSPSPTAGPTAAPSPDQPRAVGPTPTTPGAPTPTTAPPPVAVTAHPAPVHDAGTLPFTGFAALGALVLALTLLVAGATALMTARRRPSRNGA